MSRRQVALRLAAAVGALAGLVGAIALLALAVDVSRADEALASGDVRFRRTPERPALWDAEKLFPADAAARILELEDDLTFREALRRLRLGRLEDPVVSDPELAIRRNDAQALLEEIVASGAADPIRSRASGLLGVLGLSRFVYETEEREALLATTVASLRLAIELDPDNEEAKLNLELAYQRGRGYELTESSGGAKPTPGGSGSKGAGAGQPGSGY